MDNSSMYTRSLVVVSVIFPLLASISLYLRFCARRFTSQPILVDDWMILVALMLCWACSINLWVFTALVGLDTVKSDIATSASLIFKFFYINNIPFSLVLGASKLAVLLFYKRIFVIKPFQIAVWVMIVLVGAWTIAIVPPCIWMNDPISGAWTDYLHTQRVDQDIYSLAVGGMSICFDMIILCMPLFVIRTLQMPLKRKFMVGGIFWLGSIAVIASAVRFRLLYQGVYEVSHNPNAYAVLTEAFHWAVLEPNVAVIAASLPTLRPLFTFDKTRGDSWFASIRSRLLSSRGSRSGKSFDTYETSDNSLPEERPDRSNMAVPLEIRNSQQARRYAYGD